MMENSKDKQDKNTSKDDAGDSKKQIFIWSEADIKLYLDLVKVHGRNIYKISESFKDKTFK